MLGYRETNDKPPVHLKETRCFLGKCAICGVILLCAGRWCCDTSRTWEPAFSASTGYEEAASPLYFQFLFVPKFVYYKKKKNSTKWNCSFSCSAPNFNYLSRLASFGFASLDYHGAGRKNIIPNPNLSTGRKSICDSIPHNLSDFYIYKSSLSGPCWSCSLPSIAVWSFCQ